MVSKVGVNGLAWRAGLRIGDFISRVNEVNVSRASCESVAKMIKNSKTRLLLEIYRDPNELSQQPIANPIFTKEMYEQNNYQQLRGSGTASLEMVPEEEDEQNEEVQLVQNVRDVDTAENFARVYASLKYVDSVTSPSSENEDDDDIEDDEEEDDQDDDDREAADKLRRAAAQYIGTTTSRSSQDAMRCHHAAYHRQQH